MSLKVIALKVIASLRVILIVAAELPLLANAQLPTNNVKPYRSEAGGFEVDYPNDWTAVTENKGDSLVVLFVSPRVRDLDVPQAATIIVCSTPIGEIAWNACTERDSHLRELYKDRVQSRTEIVVGTSNIERIETASRYDDAFLYYARFSAQGRKFFVKGYFPRAFNLNRCAPVFEKMLETFRVFPEAKRSKWERS